MLVYSTLFEREGISMKEITIKRKDRNIDVIKEKMLEILDEYE